MTYTRNGEIFYIKSDGKNEVRLSREIEPDRAPRFLNGTQVFAIKGEPRYSRVLSLRPQDARAISASSTTTRSGRSRPNMNGSPIPTGTKLLIVSERDGDTISGKRGVYLVDLERKSQRMIFWPGSPRKSRRGKIPPGLGRDDVRPDPRRRPGRRGPGLDHEDLRLRRSPVQSRLQILHAARQQARRRLYLRPAQILRIFARNTSRSRSAERKRRT